MSRRPRIPEAASHDRWLVSYSDFITVLFALFVVLFATSYRDNRAIRKVSQAIHIGFQEMGSASTPPAVVEPTSPAGVPGAAPIAVPEMGAANPVKEALPVASSMDFTKLQNRLQAAIGDEIKNHEVVLHSTPEGFVISLKDLGFFNSGQAVLLPGASGKIRRIATVLADEGLNLRVEGHSDDQPIHTAQFHSNWDLSTARAMAVLTLLVDDSGMDPARISVAGYGQYKPVADNRTPEGRQQNRRVDLVVVGTTRAAASAGAGSPNPPATAATLPAKPSAGVTR